MASHPSAAEAHGEGRGDPIGEDGTAADGHVWQHAGAGRHLSNPHGIPRTPLAPASSCTTSQARHGLRFVRGPNNASEVSSGRLAKGVVAERCFLSDGEIPCKR